jgi:hypothetical protein
MNLVSLFTVLYETPPMPDVAVAITLIAVGFSVVMYRIIKRK